MKIPGDRSHAALSLVLIKFEDRFGGLFFCPEGGGLHGNAKTEKIQADPLHGKDLRLQQRDGRLCRHVH